MSDVIVVTQADAALIGMMRAGPALKIAARALHAIGVEDVGNPAENENGDRRLPDIVDLYASKRASCGGGAQPRQSNL